MARPADHGDKEEEVLTMISNDLMVEPGQVLTVVSADRTKTYVVVALDGGKNLVTVRAERWYERWWRAIRWRFRGWR